MREIIYIRLASVQSVMYWQSIVPDGVAVSVPPEAKK